MTDVFAVEYLTTRFWTVEEAEEFLASATPIIVKAPSSEYNYEVWLLVKQ